PSSPPAARVLSEPLPLSPPRRQGPLPADCAMFQCSGCWAVLGDSLHLCAEEKRLGVLVCYSQCPPGPPRGGGSVGGFCLMFFLFSFSAYNALSCHSCGLIVGFILYSAPHHLASLRGFFCLFKDSIFCYLLGKQTVTEASKVNFPVVTLKQKLQEVS
ncbi:MS18B protein, partial [Nycticryphes semicollaris]|nr:MS18B protein [Nycticryphes semicollaris]